MIYIFIAMIMMHIIDDYYLQGCLANLKQKSWWKKNAPDKLYKNDYKVALFMHSFSWSVMISIPILLIKPGIWFLLIYPFNVLVHYITDNAKANLKIINLKQDQCVHILQIIFTLFYAVCLKTCA